MRPRQIVRRYLRTASSSIDEVRPELWTDVDAERYVDGSDKYQAAILEQYKIYVEMGDRVSARRGLTNTFFLTLNTLIVTIVTVFWKDRPTGAVWYLLVPLSAVLLQCGAWFWLLRSYRQLNAAKGIVIGALEERLPASPYWRGEWKALGEGKLPARYWPLTHLEQWIPASFAVVYVAAFVIALVA